MSGATKLMTPGGGGVNITPASSIASDVTVSVPSVTGTLVNTGSTAQVSQAMLASGVAGNGPAFSAYQSSLQSVSNTTWTKVQLQTESFDTASCFDNSTNYRFTPNVSGYYQINAALQIANTGVIPALSIYKNGSAISQATASGAAGINPSVATSALAYLNGSTDYIELYVYQSSGSSQNTGAGINVTNMSGSMTRAA